MLSSARTPRRNRPIRKIAVLAALRRMGIAEEETSGYGLRAIGRTLLDERSGVRPYFLEHQLAHVERAPNCLKRCYPDSNTLRILASKLIFITGTGAADVIRGDSALFPGSNFSETTPIRQWELHELLHLHSLCGMLLKFVDDVSGLPAP